MVPHISSHHFLSSCLCPFWCCTTKSFPSLTPAIQILYASKSHSSRAVCEAHSICSESLSWSHVRWLFPSMYIFSTPLGATLRDGATMVHLPPGLYGKGLCGCDKRGHQEVAKEDTGEVWLLTIVNPQGDRGRWWQVVVDGRTWLWNPI